MLAPALSGAARAPAARAPARSGACGGLRGVRAAPGCSGGAAVAPAAAPRRGAPPRRAPLPPVAASQPDTEEARSPADAPQVRPRRTGSGGMGRG
jgi:hypothetical protein